MKKKDELDLKVKAAREMERAEKMVNLVFEGLAAFMILLIIVAIAYYKCNIQIQ